MPRTYCRPATPQGSWRLGHRLPLGGEGCTRAHHLPGLRVHQPEVPADDRSSRKAPNRPKGNGRRSGEYPPASLGHRRAKGVGPWEPQPGRRARQRPTWGHRRIIRPKARPWPPRREAGLALRLRHPGRAPRSRLLQGHLHSDTPRPLEAARVRQPPPQVRDSPLPVRQCPAQSRRVPPEAAPSSPAQLRKCSRTKSVG
jgi:hypothetical protein